MCTAPGSAACSARTVGRLLPATITFHVARSFTPITWSSHQPPLRTSMMWLCAGSGAFAADAPNSRDRSMVDGGLLHCPTMGQWRGDASGREAVGDVAYGTG